jgi:hypothetical protein
MLDMLITSAVDGGDWSASSPDHFTSRERAPYILWIGGWMGPTGVLDTVEMREISYIFPLLGMEPQILGSYIK